MIPAVPDPQTCQALSQCVNALGRHDRRCPAAVPDPRFRDQLAEVVRATVAEDDETEALDIVYAWLGGDRAARTLLTRPEYDALTANIAQALADARAEVEARVRAAA